MAITASTQLSNTALGRAAGHDDITAVLATRVKPETNLSKTRSLFCIAPNPAKAAISAISDKEDQGMYALLSVIWRIKPSTPTIPVRETVRGKEAIKYLLHFSYCICETWLVYIKPVPGIWISFPPGIYNGTINPFLRIRG